MGAAGGRQTTVVGTLVVIIAVSRYPTAATAVVARFPRCTGIPVVAAIGGEFMSAAKVRGAGICRTRILVIAVWCPLAEAPSTLALVVQRASVAVFAICTVGTINAARLRLAGIIGAQVPVVTLQPSLAGALAQMTEIPCGANIIVVTGSVVQEMDTPTVGRASIVGADVFVVALQGVAGNAFPPLTLVTESAGIAVIAKR
jgi:hypothetical protein